MACPIGLQIRANPVCCPNNVSNCVRQHFLLIGCWDYPDSNHFRGLGSCNVVFTLVKGKNAFLLIASPQGASSPQRRGLVPRLRWRAWREASRHFRPYLCFRWRSPRERPIIVDRMLYTKFVYLFFYCSIICVSLITVLSHVFSLFIENSFLRYRYRLEQLSLDSYQIIRAYYQVNLILRGLKSTDFKGLLSSKIWLIIRCLLSSELDFKWSKVNQLSGLKVM
jgi:hypothetical protein